MTGLEPEREPPRFPCVAALLCAACLGAAAWTWMRYSYAWDATPRDFWSDRDWSTHPVPELRWAVEHRGAKGDFCQDESWIDSYVCLRGDTWAAVPVGIFPAADGDAQLLGPRQGLVTLYGAEGCTLKVRAPDVRAALWEKCIRDEAIAIQASEPVAGRAKLLRTSPTSAVVYVDTTASRLTGASVAGLVVGAMGVFVFTVALRDWLGERKRFREAATGPGPGAGRERGP